MSIYRGCVNASILITSTQNFIHITLKFTKFNTYHFVNIEKLDREQYILYISANNISLCTILYNNCPATCWNAHIIMV